MEKSFMKVITPNYTPDEGPGCGSSANFGCFMSDCLFQGCGVGTQNF
jgi:hypothetical protein